MGKFAKKLREYLDRNPIQYAEGDSLLDELYWCYIESNYNADPEIRKQFQKLYSSMPELSPSKFEEIFSLINTLTSNQEKSAFQTGVKIGFRLAAELLE